MINVEGDSIGAGIVAHLCRNDLDPEVPSSEVPPDYESNEDTETGSSRTLDKLAGEVNSAFENELKTEL